MFHLCTTRMVLPLQVVTDIPSLVYKRGPPRKDGPTNNQYTLSFHVETPSSIPVASLYKTDVELVCADTKTAVEDIPTVKTYIDNIVFHSRKGMMTIIDKQTNGQQIDYTVRFNIPSCKFKIRAYMIKLSLTDLITTELRATVYSREFTIQACHHEVKKNSRKGINIQKALTALQTVEFHGPMQTCLLCHSTQEQGHTSQCLFLSLLTYPGMKKHIHNIVDPIGNQ